METNKCLEELKGLINDSFLDRHLKYKKRIEEDTLEEVVDYFLSLNCIDSLGLSEEELVFIIHYLGSLGILVRGRTSCYSGICDNYIQIARLKRNSISKEALTEEETKKYLEEYRRTKDITIRNKIVESNLFLVRYLSFQYSNLYGVEQEVLESYGAEGLIMALDTYDPTRGKFGAHLSMKIQDYIFRAITIYNLGEDGQSFLNSVGKKRDTNTKYFEYLYTKAKVEQQTGKKLKDDLELIEVITHHLEKVGYCEGKDLEELRTRLFANYPYSYEQMEEDLCYFDDDTLYGETVEKVFQQELAEFLEDITEELSEKRKKALRSYYGLGGRKGNSLVNIGKMEGVTRETIRLRCEDGKEELKKKLNSWYWQRSPMTKSFLEYSNHEYEGNPRHVYIKK